MIRTPARCLLSPTVHRVTLTIVRKYFLHYVWYFRFGISCFVAMLIVKDDLWRNLLIAAMIPANQSLIATALFVSSDILRLLLRSYDFLFATIINSLNWIAFTVVLGDKRAIASILGWFGMQIVVTVDASYRTFPTAVGSMRLGVPVVFILFAVVSLRSIDGAHFFVVTIDGQRIYDAADIMGFTSFTLAILLAKIAFLKKRRVEAPSRGAGYFRIPCALIKVTLCLSQEPSEGETQRHGSSVSNRVQSQTLRSPTDPQSLRHFTSASPVQQLILSPLKITHIDARRTLITFAWWEHPSMFLVSHQLALRFMLYLVGSVGYGSLVALSIRTFQSQLNTESSSSSISECFTHDHTFAEQGLAFIAFSCSALFCNAFVLFYQRDLLRLLLTNFDYVFSIGQVATFQFCLLDMVCWDLEVSLTTATWAMWVAWALTIDALTPFVKKSIFRLPTKLAAFILASALLSGLSTTYLVIFVKNNGFRDRTVVNLAFSSAHSLALTTRSILLGRAATICLWSTRQVVVLLRRREDELHLIRGLVEYESPFGLFPHNHNKHQPAIPDDALQTRLAPSELGHRTTPS